MKRTKNAARCALLFALSAVFNLIESLVTVFPAFPGIKAGLSNLPVMYALLTFSPSSALSVAVLKSLFVLATRGVSAGLLSLSGSLLSVAGMLGVKALLRERLSYTTLSVTGGILHNVAQILASAILWESGAVFSLLPLLTLAGAAAGAVNAVLLRYTVPFLKKGGKAL